ncbi:unnamed protein product, partial [Porites evermanni]
PIQYVGSLATKSAKMNAIKTKICDASTLILVARSSTLNSYFDYRILLLERAAKSAFMPSTYVFPGGLIEKHVDFSNDWMELFKQSFAKFGTDFTTLVNIQGPRPPVLKKSTTDIPSEVAFRICAIRETFEESGILLLKNLSSKHQSRLSFDEVQIWRKKVYADASNFLNMCRWLRCVPDVWSLSEWSNWKTPASLPRQYDTMFYTCFIDKEPAVHVDKQEMMHSMWMTPASAVSKCIQGQINLGVPQIYEMSRFCRFPKWSEFQSFQDRRATLGCEQWLAILLQCTDGILDLFPHDDLYASQHKRVLDELSKSSTGQISMGDYPETIADCNSKGRNFNRMVHPHSCSLHTILCNVSLPHGQCVPLTDHSKIHQLAKELRPLL